MSDSVFVPCPEWAEKLSNLHSHKLSSPDQAALETHLASCQACAAVLLEYQRMDDRIQQVLSFKTVPSFTSDLLRAREATSQKRWHLPQGMQQERHDLGSRRRGTCLLVALVLLISAVAGTGFLAFAPKNASSTPASQQAAPTRIPSIPASTADVGTYPRLATSYAGTIVDLLSGEKTAMFLTGVQQNRGNIQGSFQGLSLVSPFKGTVSSSGKIHFTVSVYGGNETLSFDGTIKIGGDIVGTFDALDQNGNKSGESGVWSIAPNS